MFFYPGKTGRWSGVLLAGGAVIALLSMAMLAEAFSRSRSVSFPSLLAEHFGILPARVLLAGAAVYYGSEICVVIVKQTRMTGLFLLEKTPPQVIPAVTLLTVCFIITSGIRQIARAAELLFPAIVIPLAFILAMGLFTLDPGELLPLLHPDRPPVESLRQMPAAFGGITAAAFFAGYYDRKKLRRCLLGGTTALAVFCGLILTGCVGVFSVRGAGRLAFPLTELSRIVSVGSVSLNHRFDILYIMIYNAVTLISAGLLFYCCCVSLCGVFSVKNHSCFIFPLLPLLYIISYFSLSDDTLITLLSEWGRLAILALLIPLLFAAAAYGRRKEAQA